jgi:hypothetical protein
MDRGLNSITRAFLLALVVTALSAGGCVSFAPLSHENAEFLARAKSQEKDGIKVTVAVLSADESERYFGVPLASKDVQPVWLKIKNSQNYPVWFRPLGTDPNYFSALEVAYRFHSTLGRETNRKMDDYFEASHIRTFVPPATTSSGFVFTPMDHGAKHICVYLFSNRQLRRFRFYMPVPGGTFDYEKVDMEHLYGPEEMLSYDLAGLRKALERLPCCTTNADGTAHGDPLNLVIIGKRENVLFPFIERGWHLTEPFNTAAGFKAVWAFLFGSKYRFSPVSPLYVFGRPQDMALQKVRSRIRERNHIRLCLAPITFEGQPVWIGQISRDIGTRFTTKTWYLITHKIDPDVDEDRGYLLQDLTAAEGVARFGYVAGVGAAPRSVPRTTLTGDPYYTDGLRLILFISDELVPLSEAEFLDWEQPQPK